MDKRGLGLGLTGVAGWLLLGIVVLSLPVPPTALSQDIPPLDQVDQLADRGQVQEARRLLARWESDYGGAATAEERARAWFLAGRLAASGEEAELHYIRVVVEGSATAWADDALLRLGQYKYAQDEYAKAVEYLRRLRRDYPTSEHGPEALLWIARTARAMGDPDRACGAVEQAFAELAPGDVTLQRELQAEELECHSTARAFYTVQVAAFKDERAAQSLAGQLLRDGFDAWVLSATPDDPLHRVRVGRDLVEAEARALVQRLSQAGLSPFLVSQADRNAGER